MRSNQDRTTANGRISRRKLVTGATAGSAAFALTGINGLGSPAPFAPSHHAMSFQEDGPELIVGHHVDPTTLDLLDSTTAAFQSVSAGIVEQFIIFDTENLTPEPWLAESFEWIDDLTLQIKLREGISFTNGEPLDAESAKVSLDRLMTSDSYSFFLKEGIYEETEIVDDHTVHLKITEPYAPILSVIARGGAAVPPLYYQEVGTEGFGQEPIGTGPFVLSEWAKDDHITLTRNPDYWNGAHSLGKVTFRVFPEDNARIAALQTGEIHIALNVPVNGLRQIESAEGVEAISVPGLRKFAMFFDSKSADAEALSDVRVRRALNMAVDKLAITESLLEGAGAPLPGQWQTEGEPGYNPEISMIEYDPDGARDLLAEAGYADGLEFQLTYTVGRYPQDKELGEIVSSYLEQVGVTVIQRPLEYGAFSTARTEDSLGTHQWGLLYPPDAVFNYRTFVRDSPYEYHVLPEEFTTLVDQASQETDPAAQQDLFTQVAQIMADEVPLLYLHVPNDNYGVSEEVQGFTPRRDQVLWLFDVSLAE
jgi:peptide/nickel transport system substrate-binding protein